MALSPSTATSARNTKHAAQITALETALDQFIEQSFETNQLVYDVAQTVTTTVFDEIVNRYRNAGWIVEIATDFKGNRRMVLQAPG